MSTERAVLQSFVPGQLIRWLAGQATTSLEPTSKDEEMVVWFADLSNFTRLTHEITERERAGPEVVTELLNRTFGSIIETVTRYGGEVLEFAGDSVLATWTVSEDLDARRAVTLAGSCGLDVVRLELPEIRGLPLTLELRVGIGIGPAILMQLGGTDDQWHFAIGGHPFDQIGTAGGAARPGEVVLSAEAASAAGHAARGQIDGQGMLRATHFEDVEPPDPRPVPDLTPELATAVSRFVSRPVLSRLDAGQSEWLGEFRRVSSMLVNLPRLDPTTPHARDSLQDVVAAVQKSLARYEGTLSRVLADDKGVTIMAAFGLPPFAHEQDPYLAVQSSEDIQQSLRQMRLEYGIGIATGRVFCGAYGSPVRRDYTTVGRDVNLAARLMQMASYETLCDEATARASRRIEFHALGERQVKGWDQPVRVFRPLWEKSAVPGPIREVSRLVGRESEQNQMVAWLGALDRAHSSAVVVVEGEAGIGKSALASDLMRTAESFDVRILHGAAVPVAQAPYQAWREVIEDLLDLAEVRSTQRRQEIVRRGLSDWPEYVEWEALLNPVLDLHFPETAATRGMSGSNRRDSTVELLVRLLNEAATQNPLLVVLDDLHWFDSASWAVAVGAARKVSPLLMVLLTRPMLERPEQMEVLMEVGLSAHLVLKPIGERESLELAKERLGAHDLEPEVAEVIVKAAEGIPFYIEELSFSLRDAEALRVEDGVAKLIRPSAELGVPHTLSSVVLTRIDQLPPQLQFTLKVASVIGRSFDTDALEAVHPGQPGVEELARELSELSELELVVETSSGSYDFKHALIGEAAYESLLFDQRRRIHRSVASYFESRGEESREPLYELLAYHWERGDDHQKALGYYEKTGASSLRKGADREAIAAYSRALELVHQHPQEFDHVDQLRRSQWHMEIGQAHQGVGSVDDAKESLYRALEMVRVRTPANPVGKVARLIWEFAKQLLHIAAPVTIRVPEDPDERARLGQAAHVAALLGEIYYFTGDLLTFPMLNFLAINRGEKANEPLVAGLAYSNLGYLLGTLRLKRLAGRYFRMARRAEEIETDPGAVHTPFVAELQEMGPGHLIAVALAESVLALTFDEWDRAREIITEGLERCNRLGDRYSAGIALAIRGFGSYSEGRLDAALADYDRLLASAYARSNREHEGWATSLVIPVLLAVDRVSDAEGMARAATAIIDSVDALTVPIIHGTRAQVQLRLGEADEARRSAEQALETIDSTPIFIYLAGFAGMLDTLLELWSAEANPKSESAKELARLTRRGLRKMSSFAMILPFARPKYRLYKGRMQHLGGRTAKARRTLQKGLDLARDKGLLWDEGLLRLELARISPEDSEARTAHATEARRLLQDVGSRQDLDRLAALVPQR